MRAILGMVWGDTGGRYAPIQDHLMIFSLYAKLSGMISRRVAHEIEQPLQHSRNLIKVAVDE